MLGIPVLVGGPVDVGVSTLADSRLFRIDAPLLITTARRDAAVAWALAEEVNRRLYENLRQTAMNAFGTVRQRVAVHLPDLAAARQRRAPNPGPGPRSKNSPTPSDRFARSSPGCCATSASPGWWPSRRRAS